MHAMLTYLTLPGGRFFTKECVRGYCFGFNVPIAIGKMKDDEVYGEGNSYTAEYWQCDPRLGRRWNVDPVVKQYESPYACFGNNPIWFVDPTGADSTTYLYSELGADGKALYSPEQLQKIADVSKQIDEKNGITFTKYQVYAAKVEFEKAISNGSENINELIDLVYSISDKTSGGWGFIQVGVTDASPTNYSVFYNLYPHYK